MQSKDEACGAWKAANLVPLWKSANVFDPSVTVAPHVWRWSDLRPLLEIASRETSPTVVERRVLQLVSPHARLPTDEFTSGALLAAVQCLLPGEVARPHRHSMSALRFVLEGEGAVTVVDGKPCEMLPGDLILTPAWSWHEHHHGGTEPVLWLDALDVPLHAMLGTGEFEPGPVHDVPVTVADDVFAAANLLPDEIPPVRGHSPVFRYPYAEIVAALGAVPPASDGTRRVRYVNPVTGGPAMAPLDVVMMQVDPGPASRRRRSNANAIALIVEGYGTSEVGVETLSWGPKDIIAFPQWAWTRHTAIEGPVRMLVVSEREILRALGAYREETDVGPN